MAIAVMRNGRTELVADISGSMGKLVSFRGIPALYVRMRLRTSSVCLSHLILLAGPTPLHGDQPRRILSAR